MRALYIIPVTVLLVMSGCSGGGGDGGTGTNETQPGGTTATGTGIPRGTLASLEASGQLPKLDRSADLRGPDAGNNAIRDDIDAFLEAKRLDQQKLQAAQQVARAYQSVLTINLQDKEAIRAAEIKADNASNCLAQRFGASFAAVSTELENYTFNTRQRMAAYDAYNKALDGTVGSIPEGDTCE